MRIRILLLLLMQNLQIVTKKFTRFWRLLQIIKNQLPKILRVATDYPPMRGGVGRYTFNLVRQLRKKELTVLVASNEEGNGDFFGLAPANNENYLVLLKIVDEIQPDIVHIQYKTCIHSYTKSQLGMRPQERCKKKKPSLDPILQEYNHSDL